jgi:hypothetical protein
MIGSETNTSNSFLQVVQLTVWCFIALRPVRTRHEQSVSVCNAGSKPDFFDFSMPDCITRPVQIHQVPVSPPKMTRQKPRTEQILASCGSTPCLDIGIVPDCDERQDSDKNHDQTNRPPMSIWVFHILLLGGPGELGGKRGTIDAGENAFYSRFASRRIFCYLETRSTMSPFSWE